MKSEITIVLPCFNVEKYIERCVQSLKNQTYKYFNVIFVDDNSSDNTCYNISSILNDYRFSLVKNNTNLGTLKSRLIGFNNTETDYVMFLDPDDEIPLDAVEIVMKVIYKSNPDLIIGVVDVFSHNGVFKHSTKLPMDSNNSLVLKSIFLDVKSPYMSNPGKVYNRRLIEIIFSQLNSINMPVVYGEDVLMFFLATLNATSFRSVNQSIYKYYLNNTSITRAASTKKLFFNANQLFFVLGLIESNVKNLEAQNVYVLNAYNKVNFILRRDLGMLLLKIIKQYCAPSSFVFKHFGYYSVGGGLKPLLKILIYFVSFSFVKIE